MLCRVERRFMSGCCLVALSVFTSHAAKAQDQSVENVTVTGQSYALEKSIDDKRANEALEFIRQLYAIERDLPPLLPPSDDPVAQEQRRRREEHRRAIRQKQAEPILAELKKWLDENKAKTLPKTPLGQAIEADAA